MERKFLRKLAKKLPDKSVWITQNHAKNQICSGKLLKNADICSNFSISRLMLQSMKEPFHQFSTWAVEKAIAHSNIPLH